MRLMMTDAYGRREPAAQAPRTREEREQEREWERVATAPFRAVIDYFRLDADRHAKAADAGTNGPPSRPVPKRD